MNGVALAGAPAGSGLTVAARAVGIGLVAAAAGAVGVIAELRPRLVVLVGTCGAYVSTDEQAPKIHDVVVARAVRLVSTAVAEGRSAFPAPMPLVLESEPHTRQALAEHGPAAIVDVATTLAVTTDDPLAARTAAASGCAVEHLEAFAVAHAAAASGAAFAAVFGVANTVGSTGREEWRAHHLSAGARAADLVVRWLQKGARGFVPRVA